MRFVLQIREACEGRPLEPRPDETANQHTRCGTIAAESRRGKGKGQHSRCAFFFIGGIPETTTQKGLEHMKHAESFNAKYLSVFVKTAEKARQYQTPEEAAEIEQFLSVYASAKSEQDIPEPERNRIESRFDEIIRLSTARYIIDTFPHDLETLMQEAESDLIELDPQSIKAAWTEQRRERAEQLKANPAALDDLELIERSVDGDAFTRAIIARCMEPYVKAFCVFGHDLTMLESLLEKYDTAESGRAKTPRKRKQIHIDALPDQLIYPLDAVNHYAANGSFQAGAPESVEMFPKQYRLPNGKYSKGKPVEVFAMLEYEGTDIAQRLDLIDSAILRGIYSLLDAGETRFSVSHIWELIAGEGQKTNRSRIENLVLRIRRMIGTTAKISFQQFAEAKGLEYTDDITAQILPGVALRERRNARGELVGADLKCTQPLESFPLYQFAEITGQIDRAPIEAVTVRGSTKDAKSQLLTDKRLTVREMIYQRIFRRHRNKSDQVILFATLYEKVGATTTQQQIRVRDAAESFLIEWAELGTIYNYSFRKKGKNIDAIVIANTPEEMQNHPGLTWLAR